MTVSAEMQQRRGTAAAWTAANPTLLPGEIGVESDTGNIKIGDGTTAWNSLQYGIQHGAYAPQRVTPSSAGPFAKPKLIDPLGRSQFAIRGIDGAGAMTVENSNWNTHRFLVSRDWGATFNDILVPPYNFGAAGKAVWFNGKILMVFNSLTDGKTHLYAFTDDGLTNTNSLGWAVSGFEDAGLVGWFAQTNCSIAQSSAWAAEGTKSMAMTSTAAGTMVANAQVGTALIPAAAGDTWSCAATVRAATAGRTVNVGIQFLDATANTLLAQTNGAGVTDSTTVDTLCPTASAVAPANTAFVSMVVIVAATGAGGEVHYVDKAVISKGSSAVWTTGRYQFSKVLDYTGPDGTLTTTCFVDASATAICTGTPGNPAAGPLIARSTDGTTFTTTYPADNRFRHIHCVIPDPYNVGHWWASMGDNSSPWKPLPFFFLHSTDDGATWNPVTIAAGPSTQGVQLSFTPNWVYAAGDSSDQSPWFRFKRDGSKCEFIATNPPPATAVPGGASDVFDTNTFYAKMDATNGVMHGCSISATGENAGYWVLEQVGARMELVATDVGSVVTDGQTVSGNTTISAPGLAPTSSDVGRLVDAVQITGGQAHPNYTTISTVAATTVAAASNGAALPQATINVLDTTNFAAAGTAMFTTAAGVQIVTYTGKTATTFTGCTGGVGILQTNQAVSQVILSANASATVAGETLTIPARAAASFGEVFIGNGYAWFGIHKHPLFTVAALSDGAP